MTDAALVDSALVDAALRKSGLISNGCSGHRRLCRVKQYVHYVPKIPQGRTHSYYPCHFNCYFPCQNVYRTQIAY